MADEEDSKSFVGNYVWVQVPPPAGLNKHRTRESKYWIPAIYILYLIRMNVIGAHGIRNDADGLSVRRRVLLLSHAQESFLQYL